MYPIGITFVDNKFLPFAQEQQKNFNNFGLEHHIIPINSNGYDIKLWTELIDATISAVKKYGKILKVDAEVRIEKEIPDYWAKANNVFFFIEPIITKPYYVALNTGQIILDESSLEFLHYQKLLTESLIPPNYNGKLYFDDEDMTAPAIKLSNVEYFKEIIDYNRSDNSRAKATRGWWKTKDTVLTHPFFHNWNTQDHTIADTVFFKNHFCPNDPVQLVDAAILGIKKGVINNNYWKSIGFEWIDDAVWTKNDWFVNPNYKSYWHKDFRTEKFID